MMRCPKIKTTDSKSMGRRLWLVVFVCGVFTTYGVAYRLVVVSVPFDTTSLGGSCSPQPHYVVAHNWATWVFWPAYIADRQIRPGAWRSHPDYTGD